MRKVGIGIIAVILIAVVCIYLLIPSEIKISTSVVINCTSGELSNCLRNAPNWKRWWPQQNANGSSNVFAYNDCSYQLTAPYRDGAAIQLTKKNESYPTRLLFLPYSRDSVTAQWETGFKTSLNPVVRVMQYCEAFHIKNSLATVLKSLQKFADRTENIYGFHIVRTTFTDSILVATRFSSSVYPSTATIYAAVNKLKALIAAAGAKEEDHPMVNVNKKDSGHYETMIAICVNKGIKTGAETFISRMVVMKDRFLITEVTGGPYAIHKAHNAINNYMEDHLLSQPGIPFEILITDRSRETDTSKWKTRIVYPSM